MDGTSLAASQKQCTLSAVILASCHLCCDAHVSFHCGFFWLVMDAVVMELVAMVMRTVAIVVSCHRDKCGCCLMELVVVVIHIEAGCPSDGDIVVICSVTVMVHI